MNGPIRFGTDGWRGIIADDFTAGNVRICAQGVADYLRESGSFDKGIVIGYDNRFASEYFAAAAAEVMCGNGVRVYLTPRSTPTPAVSFGAVTKKAAGAIVITASHNPPAWNGFKYKTGDGASAPPEVASSIEQNIHRISRPEDIRRVPLPKAESDGLLEYFDIAPPYLERLRQLVDVDSLKRSGLEIAIDPMYGSAIRYLTSILGGGVLELTEIHDHRNPVFPGMKQPEPIAANLTDLSRLVKERGASAGLATDGDADRVGVVDEDGNCLTTLQVFSLLCFYFLEVRGERGTIVKTLTMSCMVERLGHLYHVPVRETKVGFKYVAPIMMAENALVGGEESGGYGFRGHVPERDGILASLYFLDLMVKTGKKPAQLIQLLYEKVGPHYFNRRDLEFPPEERNGIIVSVSASRPAAINGRQVVKMDSYDGYRFFLDDGSWLLVRFSGTEPLLRIYAESDTPGHVESLLEQGQKLAGL